MNNISFQQNENENNDHTSNNNEFVGQLVLVIIPIIVGVITTKWLTNSWQNRSEENKVRKEILNDFGNSYERALGLTDVFFLLLMEKYTNYQDVAGSIRDSRFTVYLNFPLDKRIKLAKEFLASFAKFQDEIYQTNLNEGQFTSTVRLYYGDNISEQELSNVADRIDSLYFIIRRLINSGTRHDFDDIAFEYDSTYNAVRIIVRDFKRKLIETKLAR